MAITGRRSGGRAAVGLGLGARAARSAERTPWGSSVGGRRPLDRRRQALLLHSLRKLLREVAGEPHDSNSGYVALRDACTPDRIGSQVDTDVVRPAAWQDDAPTTNKVLWSSGRHAPLRHCLRQGLGSGMREGRPVTARMAGDVLQGGCGVHRPLGRLPHACTCDRWRDLCFYRICITFAHVSRWWCVMRFGDPGVVLGAGDLLSIYI